MNIIIDQSKEKTKLPGVMRAALKLFVKKGIDGTTIKDIAREAKVAEGALYRHFKSKDDLAWHLFSTHLDAFTKELTEKVFAHTSAQERIQCFVRESFAAFESDPELYTYLILREHSELQKYPQNFVHPGHIVVKVVEDGQKTGEIKAGNAYVLAAIFIGSIIRVCVTKMYGSIQEDVRSFTGDVADSIWSALKKQGDKI
jgi:AcrR family transcriptional regulator